MGEHANEGPQPLREARGNKVSRGISEARLNGRVYTPQALAQAVVATLPLREGMRVVDPTCGDGAFLEAILSRADALGLRVEVAGWDTDASALHAARARLGDRADLSLAHRDGLGLSGPWDLVVGNPPYLEAKRMPDVLKARAKALAPWASTGAFDLYAVFVELAARALAPGGHLAFVVPNRLLLAEATARLRRELCARGRVDVRDLSGVRVFEAAAVYPVVLTWTSGGRGIVLGGSEVPAAMLDALGGRWPLPGQGLTPLVARLCGGEHPRFVDGFEARWTVSFHKAGLREQFVHAVRPDTPSARPFLGGAAFAGNREVQPYRISWAGAWIDYDEARARSAGNPLAPLAMFDGPKVALPQNVRRLRGALDVTGAVLKDTFLCLRARDGVDAEASLRWLLLVLHSDVFHLLFAAMAAGSRKAGGFLQVSVGGLGALPVPACPDPVRAVALHDALARGEPVAREAEGLVSEAFGLTGAERTLVASQDFPRY